MRIGLHRCVKRPQKRAATPRRAPVRGRASATKFRSTAPGSTCRPAKASGARLGRGRDATHDELWPARLLGPISPVRALAESRRSPTRRPYCRLADTATVCMWKLKRRRSHVDDTSQEETGTRRGGGARRAAFWNVKDLVDHGREVGGTNPTEFTLAGKRMVAGALRGNGDRRLGRNRRSSFCPNRDGELPEPVAQA